MKWDGMKWDGIIGQIGGYAIKLKANFYKLGQQSIDRTCKD